MNSTDDLSGPNMKEVPPSVSNSQLNPDTLDKTQRSAVGTPDYLAPEILLGIEHGEKAVMNAFIYVQKNVRETGELPSLFLFISV